MYELPYDVQAEESACTSMEEYMRKAHGMGDAYDDAEDEYWASGTYAQDVDHKAALEAASPEARGLLELIFDHNAKEAEWSRERLKEMDEVERLRAIKMRGNRIIARMGDILALLYDVHPPMEYKEEKMPYGIEKTLTLTWVDDYLEDRIQA
jgi:hypothetical protein